MTSTTRNEISYYQEISDFISQQITSNLKAAGLDSVSVYFTNGEMRGKLRELINNHPKECHCLESYVKGLPPLNVDIIGVVTNGKIFQLIILEVKLKKVVGLSEWSQLIGYLLVSGASFGLLININNGVSERLLELLYHNNDISHLKVVTNHNSLTEHKLGVMTWNSLTMNFEYSNLGALGSIGSLSEHLVAYFSGRDEQCQ